MLTGANILANMFLLLTTILWIWTCIFLSETSLTLHPVQGRTDIEVTAADAVLHTAAYSAFKVLFFVLLELLRLLYMFVSCMCDKHISKMASDKDVEDTRNKDTTDDCKLILTEAEDKEFSKRWG